MPQNIETPPGQTAGLANASLRGSLDYRENAPKNHATQEKYSSDEKLAALSDRNFFRRFRDRQAYIRPATVGEIERLGAGALPPGAAWFAIAKREGARYVRRRWFIADAEMIFAPAASEDEAREVWESLCNRNRGVA